MNIFENFWNFFFDSVQYVRYDPRRKFDADGGKLESRQFFKYYQHDLVAMALKGFNKYWSFEPSSDPVEFRSRVPLKGQCLLTIKMS
jgi:hypothetical protein